MKDHRGIIAAAILTIGAFLLLTPPVWGKSHPSPFFDYAGGTENLPKGCEGKLEIKEKNLVYHCGDVSVVVPYSSITQMEFLPKVSKQIRKMKLDWAVKPTSSHSKHEGFFSVLFSGSGQTHAIVLKVSDDTMRPYMAEIDLKTGRSIESHQD